MNPSSVPVLASEVTEASPASFVIAANTKAVHDLYQHHGQVYIQGIAKPSYKGEDSSVSLTIGKRVRYSRNLFATSSYDYNIKLTQNGITASSGHTAALSGS